MAWVRKLPSGRWQACWRDPGGQVRTRAFRRRDVAVKYGRDRESDRDRGTYHDPALGRQTLEAFWHRYFEAADLAPSTRTLQAGHFRNHIGPALGHRPLGAITGLEVDSVVRSLVAGDVGRPTIGAVMRLLNRLLNAAVLEGRIVRNPAKGVRVPALEPKEMRFLSVEEVEQLVEATPDRWRAFVLMLAWGGFRIGELAALRADRIDWLRRQTRVEEQLVEVSGRLLERPTTKTRRSRSVAMPAFVMEALAEHVRRWPPLGGSGLVFYGPRATPVRRGNFDKRVFKPALEAAGLAPMRVHDLRHTAVALAIAAGGHPKAIQARAGHASIRTTLDRYGHLMEGLDAALADRLEVLGRRSAARRSVSS